MKRGLLPLLGLAACSGDGLILPPLIDPGAASVVVAWEAGADTGCARLQAEAAAVITSDGLILSAGRAGIDATYWALLIPRNLEAAGLKEGPLATQPVDPSDCQPIELAANTLSLSIHGGKAGAWTPVPSAATPIASCVCLRKPARPSDCATFIDRGITLPETAHSNFALPIGPSSALVNAAGVALLYLVDIGTATPTARPIAIPAGMPTGVGLLMDGGQIWFGGAGALWRGSLVGDAIQATPVATASTADDFLWIDGSRSSSAATDLLLLASGGRWTRFDGQGFTELYAFPPTTEVGGLFRGATLYNGASEALAVKGNDSNVVRAKGGQISLESPGFGRETFAALARISGLGTLAGSTTGSIYLDRGDGTWRLIGNANVFSGLRTFAPYDDGFIFGGDGGSIGQYRPSAGVCGLGVVAHEQVNWVLPFGEDLLFGTDTGAGSQTTLILRRRVP